MIVLTYTISEKASILILNTDINTLKQIINIILVVVVVSIFFYKKDIKND